ncbi:solute carrier family 31 (copper transporter), member 1, partial [Tremellales sp. Uapishka_1]
MTMKSYLHGSTGTDALWFASWMPTSAGATVGVCFGLFLLGIFERYVAAFRRGCNDHWNKGQITFAAPQSSGSYSPSPTPSREAFLSQSESSNSKDSETDYNPVGAPSYELNDAAAGEKIRTHAHLPKAVRKSLEANRAGRWSRPFRWNVDIPRGLLQALHAALGYLLMLVVMTFQIWWIISLVVGAGVGEVLFGRFGGAAGAH